MKTITVKFEITETYKIPIETTLEVEDDFDIDDDDAVYELAKNISFEEDYDCREYNCEVEFSDIDVTEEDED